MKSIYGYSMAAIDSDEALVLFMDTVSGVYKTVLLRFYTSNFTQISVTSLNSVMIPSSAIVQSSNILNMFGRATTTYVFKFLRVRLPS